jgi:Uma2 family endonuclease
MTLLNGTRQGKGKRPKRRMTEAEFVTWALSDEFARAEWVDGEVIIMSPVSLEHTRIQNWLVGVLRPFVEYHNLGELLGPEYMVRFDRLRVRRVPDNLFVDRARLDLLMPNHLEGPPDLIMEVVSPDSESRDWREKYEEYQTVGVREYWVIDPNSKRAEAYARGKGKSFRRIAETDGVIKSTVIKGLWLKTDWLWLPTRPPVLSALRELDIGA